MVVGLVFVPQLPCSAVGPMSSKVSDEGVSSVNGYKRSSSIVVPSNKIEDCSTL